MTLRTDKDLKSKNVLGKKLIYQPRISIQTENFKSKPETFRLEKGLFFGVSLIQAVVAKTLRLFHKIFFCLQNISTLKKSASSITTSRDKRGEGGHHGPPPVLLVCKIPPSFEG